MKLILNATEVICIPSIFPEQGNFIEQTMATEIMEKVKLTIEESDRLKLQQQVLDGRLTYKWDDEEKKTFKKEIQLSNAEVEYLKDQYKRLDGEKKITMNMLSIMKKIKEL